MLIRVFNKKIVCIHIPLKMTFSSFICCKQLYLKFNTFLSNFSGYLCNWLIVEWCTYLYFYFFNLEAQVCEVYSCKKRLYFISTIFVQINSYYIIFISYYKNRKTSIYQIVGNQYQYQYYPDYQKQLSFIVLVLLISLGTISYCDI